MNDASGSSNSCLNQGGRSSIQRVLKSAGSALLVMVFSAGNGLAEAPTPQRPSFSSDPSTTAAGTVEIEAGGVRAEEGYWDAQVLVKWGTGRRSEVYVGWVPYVRSLIGQEAEAGMGDVVIGTRIRVAEQTGPWPSAAVQLNAKIPTADVESGLGTGVVDYYTAGTVMRSWKEWSVVGFLQLGFLSNPEVARLDYEYAVAVAISRLLGRRLYGFLEAAGVLNPNQDTDAISLMAGIGLPVGSATVLDGAAVVGLTNDASRWRVSLGLTHNFGNPFRHGSAPAD